MHKFAYGLASVCLTAVAALGLAAPQAAAQRSLLRGRVVDTTGAPVRDADIVVLPDSLHAVTSPDGRFSVGPVVRGEHNIRIRRIGFQFVDTTVTTPSETPFAFRMTQVPITLQAVVAEGLSAGLPRVVLREQEHLGVQIYGTHLDSLLHRLPGLTVEELLSFDRAAALTLMSSARCRAVVYVDGDSARGPIRTYVSQDEIAAIEVFNSPDFVNEPFLVGVDTAKAAGRCEQIILVWSKYYRQRPWGGR